MMLQAPYSAILANILPACAACLGATDSAQSKGMNAAVLFLLSVVLLALAALIVAGWRLMLQERRNLASEPGAMENLPTCKG